MRLLLLAVMIASGAGLCHAMRFEEVFGGPDRDRGVFVSPTKDGGYIAVGATSSFGKGDEDIYLVRTDSTGQLLWSKTYGGSDQDNGWSVHEIPTGFVLSGSTKSFGAGGFDFYLIKTDSDGKIEWSQTYGGQGDDCCWSLALASDGGFLLAGETTSSGAGEEDAMLVRTDSRGAKILVSDVRRRKGRQMLFGRSC